MEHASRCIGNLYLVSGLAGGAEVFLGKALDEPNSGRLSLEGKAASVRNGRVRVRPFASALQVSLAGRDALVQSLTAAAVIAEATELLVTPVVELEPACFPQLDAWVRSVLDSSGVGESAHPGSGSGEVPVAPWLAFRAAADRFRRGLCDSPGLRDTAALDCLAELEGALVGELGKALAKVALGLRQRIAHHAELVHELASAPQEPARPSAGLQDWDRLCGRIERARTWARRNGRTRLGQELGALYGEALTRPLEVILRLGTTLDALITETYANAGLPAGLAGIFARTGAPSPAAAGVGTGSEDYELPRVPRDPVRRPSTAPRAPSVTET